MEVVKLFNNELSSLYEVKPPISKAKMTQITKCAIKGIKFYKHVVQSVEKFIQKCRPEYKVPGLYVVDSIVRQSRHQFGADKDVFGPRFIKNITITFQHLYKCAEEDRSKIVRVLNLWQKNAVFPSDVIQPLMDMAHPNPTTEWPIDALHVIDQDSPINKSPPPSENVQNSKHKSSEHSSPWKGWSQGAEEPVSDNRTYAEMSKQNLEKFTKGEVSNLIEDETSRSSHTKGLSRHLEAKPMEENAVKFNKKLLDFDYGDEEDEEDIKHDENSDLLSQPNALALSMAQNLLSNPELLRQIQQMQNSIQQSEALKSEMSLQGNTQKLEDTQMSYSSDNHNSPLPPPSSLPTTGLESRLASFQQQFMPHEQPFVGIEVDKDDRAIHIPPPEPSLSSRDLDERSLSSIIFSDRIPPPHPYSDSNIMQFQYDNNAIPFPSQQQPLSLGNGASMVLDTAFPPVNTTEQMMLPHNQIDEDERVMYSMPGEPPLPPHDFDERSLAIPTTEERNRRERSRSASPSRSRARSGRHRSRSKSPHRRRSRSRSRTRRNRSRSRERERIREKEKEREKERERRKKGLPPIKKGCVSVCSTTLWLGHVPKSCSEVDISSTFGTYGTILSIDMIPPRGCAYVVMDRRQDGYRILQKMKNLKIQGSSIKMAWAPGKGVKGKEFKDYWEVDLGVSYVPYEKIREDADTLDFLEEGGFIDEESLSENLKAVRREKDNDKKEKGFENSAPYEMPSQPTMVPPPMIPTSVGLPMVLPHLMQPQFGIHLPGLLPPQAMVMPVPMGIPPPNPVLMVQQQSQNLLSGQPLPVVGGVPQMVPRTVPPIPQALKSLKTLASSESSLDSPVVTSTSGPGDATPTDEDGTSVSSPSTTIMTNVASNSTAITMNQFNAMMNLHNASRPMLSVPPPVSSAGTPIPFPPPHVGFGFPPPGMRPGMPGAQGMGPIPNAQFPWMQKAPEADVFGNSGAVRPALPQMAQPTGVPHPMFNIRPQFHDPTSANHPSPPNQSPVKDVAGSNSKQRDAETKPSKDGALPPIRSGSPVPPVDKMHQEMVISTDDESSMDQDFVRNDMALGPRFPNVAEFSPRGPLGMQWMRGPPPGVMPGGPRFQRGMHPGPQFPPRMGGPRMGMHQRVDMEFGRHPDDRGPRMMIGGPPPRRGEGPHGEWFPDPRDFDNPMFEMENDRWFPPNEEHAQTLDGPWVVDDRGRDDREPRRLGRDREWGRDREPEKVEKMDRPQPPQEVKPPVITKPKPKPKPPSKPKSTKEVMDDMFRLRYYAREKSKAKKPGPVKLAPADKKLALQDIVPPKQSQSENTQQIEKVGNDSLTQKSLNDNKPCVKEVTVVASEKAEQNSFNSKRERDREARRRSRWGRTLSEEREFQQQKRNEIEMKFQSYELSHSVQQTGINSDSIPNASSQSLIETSADIILENATADPINNPFQSDGNFIASCPVNEDVIPQPAGDFTAPFPVNENVITQPVGGFIAPISVNQDSIAQPVGNFTASLPVNEDAIPQPVGDFIAPLPVKENVINEPFVGDSAASDSCSASLSEIINVPVVPSDTIDALTETVQASDTSIPAPVSTES